MKKEPLVSVIMNCYNGEKYLEEAIDSVINQTYKNWEIIFWDNASTDHSSIIVNKYHDKRVKYYKGDINVTLGLARNYALEKAKGEFICILDVDDIFVENKLEIQVIDMINNPNVIVGYSSLKYLIMKNGRETQEPFTKQTFEGNVLIPLLTKDNFIYLSTVIINRRLAGESLFFNTSYQITEEYELYLRLSILGKFRFTDKILGFYRVHKGSTLRKTENNLVYVNERLDILENYNKVINENNINKNKIQSKIFFNCVLRLIRDKNTSMIKKYSGELLKYPSTKNIILYMIVLLNLSPLYYYYYHLKHKK